MGRSDTASPPGFATVSRLGRGCFGDVVLVRRDADGAEFACKRVDYSRMGADERRQLVDEVNILRASDHPNLVGYVGHHVDAERSELHIVMEHCPGGDLDALVAKARAGGGYLGERFVWSMLADLAAALAHCHGRSRAVLHRDLKPGNVLLDASGRARLCDFGLARVLRGGRRFARSTVGTPQYMSPEVVDEEPYGPAADVWSLGCLAYELAALEPPFRGSSPKALAGRIRVGRTAPLPPRYSAELRDLVARMLSADPRGRPSASEIAAHPRVEAAALAAERERVAELAARLDERERQLERRAMRLAALEQELALGPAAAGDRMMTPPGGRTAPSPSGVGGAAASAGGGGGGGGAGAGLSAASAVTPRRRREAPKPARAAVSERLPVAPGGGAGSDGVWI